MCRLDYKVCTLYTVHQENALNHDFCLVFIVLSSAGLFPHFHGKYEISSKSDTFPLVDKRWTINKLGKSYSWKPSNILKTKMISYGSAYQGGTVEVFE